MEGGDKLHRVNSLYLVQGISVKNCGQCSYRALCEQSLRLTYAALPPDLQEFLRAFRGALYNRKSFLCNGFHKPSKTNIL